MVSKGRDSCRMGWGLPGYAGAFAGRPDSLIPLKKVTLFNYFVKFARKNRDSDSGAEPGLAPWCSPRSLARMKALLAVICLLAGATILSAETTPVAPVTPAKPGAKAKVEVKKEAAPKIPGQTIARANGTFLGLEVVGGNFKLSFYDAKKKPMAVDVTRATARWPNPRSVTGPNRAVLNPSGNALVGNKVVLPPFVFNVHLILLQGEGEASAAVESYDVAFRG